jgi:hypothetical protein
MHPCRLDICAFGDSLCHRSEPDWHFSEKSIHLKQRSREFRLTDYFPVRRSLGVGGSLVNRGTHLTAADVGSAEVWVLLLAGL